jgi:hypothetical protein
MSRILQCPFQGILAMRKMMHWAGPKCLASIGQPDATESQAGKPSGDGTAGDWSLPWFYQSKIIQRTGS